MSWLLSRVQAPFFLSSSSKSINVHYPFFGHERDSQNFSLLYVSMYR